MQWGAIWSERGNPTDIDYTEKPGCAKGYCDDGVNKKQTYCNFDRYLPPGAVIDWDAYNRLTCQYTEISLKQLALWDEQLRLSFPDTYRESEPGEPENLRDLAKRIFDEFGKAARHIDDDTHHITTHTGYTQDPLLCAQVRFCRGTFEVKSYDDWNAVNCRAIVAKGPRPTTPVATCKAPIQGSDLTPCPETDVPSFIIAACTPRGLGNSHEWANGPRLMAQSLCFDAGPLSAKPGPPPAGTVTSIPAYYADTDFDFHVPVIDRDKELSDLPLPKHVNNFGSRKSLSELPYTSGTVDQLMIQDVEHLAEVLHSEDEYFRLALTSPKEDGTRIFAKDDGYAGLTLPAGIVLESVTTDRELSAMVVDAEATTSFLAAGVSHNLPAGQSLVTFDYSADISVNAIVPLPKTSPLVIGSSVRQYPATYRSLVGGADGTALLTHRRNAREAVLQRLSLTTSQLPLRYVVPADADTVLASPTLSDLLLGVTAVGERRAVFVMEPGIRSADTLLSLSVPSSSKLQVYNISRVDGEVRFLVHGVDAIHYRGGLESCRSSVVYRVTVTDLGLNHEAVVDLGEVRLDGLRTDDGQTISLAIDVPRGGFYQLGDHVIFNASPYGQSAGHVVELTDQIPERGPGVVSGIPYRLYPTPAQDYVTIQAYDGLSLASDNLELVYELFATDGKRVSRGRLQAYDVLARSYRLDVGYLPAGTYLIRVAHPETSSHTLKLVIIR